MENNLKLMVDKEAELSMHFTRMDKDADTFNLKPYVMMGTGVKGAAPKKIDKAYHVTMPDAKQFLEKATSKLISASRQVVVEGEKIAKEHTSIIENWLNDIEFEVDALLAAKGQPATYLQHAKRVCYRGPIASQQLLRYDRLTGKFIADVRPIDARWFTYELTADGMTWGAVRSERTKADIERAYPLASVSGKTGIVRDFWDKYYNFVFVNDIQVFEEINGYHKPPFTIAFPDTEVPGDMDYYSRMGDSILQSLRNPNGGNLFDENNYIASYLKTMSAESLFPAAQFPNPPDSDGYQKPPDEVPGSGQMVQVKMPAVPYPIGQLSNAMQMYIQMVRDAIQRGTFATLDHGIIDLPQSGVAIAQKVALQMDSLLPRLNCLASLSQQTARMEIEQFTAIGEVIELGQSGHERKYSPVDLGGAYTIKYRYYTQSQEQLAGATSTCAALGNLVSDETKQDEILKLQDGAGERAKIAMEQAAKANPVIDLKNKMIAFIKAQEKTDDKELKLIYDSAAKDILEQIKSIHTQRRSSETQPMPVNLEQNARVETKGAPGIPVFGGSQAVTR